MGTSSTWLRHFSTPITAALVAALGCGGEFTAQTETDGGRGTGGRKGSGTGGSPSAGGDADSGVSTGGVSSGGRGSGGRGGRASGGAATGGSGTSGSPGGGGDGSGGTGAGGAATGGSAGSATGGAPNTTQLASSYPQQCAYDGECSVVTEGDVCTCLGCPNAGIASSAMAQWDADRAKFQCEPVACPAIKCQAILPACAKGECTARKPLMIDPTHYDQTCAASTDCVRIFTGEVCSACQCAVGAVSTKGYQDYLRDKATVSCTPGPSVCDCAAVGSAACVIPAGQDKGTCAIL